MSCPEPTEEVEAARARTSEWLRSSLAAEGLEPEIKDGDVVQRLATLVAEVY